MLKPDWWPKNPYPESIFTMPEGQYLEIVPDPELRTALSGMLGRQFWDIAAEAIWEAICRKAEDTSDVIERACRAWWKAGASPGVLGWDKLVQYNDHRIPIWRAQMRAALEAIGALYGQEEQAND